jgi:hypothetical protein
LSLSDGLFALDYDAEASCSNLLALYTCVFYYILTGYLTQNIKFA